jgi:hypothetical protein
MLRIVWCQVIERSLVDMIIKKLHKDNSAGVMMFVGLSLFVLVTVVGAAVDMGRIALVRSRATIALDGAILSAASIANGTVDVATIQTTANQYFYLNFPQNFMGVHNLALTTTYDVAKSSVQGDLRFQMPTFFGGFLGLNDVTIDLTSQVSRMAGGKSMEIALVLDVTPSMCFDAAGVYSRGACLSNKGKMKALRDAVNDLVTIIEGSIAASGTAGDVYYSFVPFLHTVRIGGYVEDNDMFWDYVSGSMIKFNMSFLPSLHGLRRDGSQIVSSLDNVITTMENEGGTDTSIGTYWGWLSLRSGSVNRFMGVSAHENTTKHPVPINTANTYKMIIILTDGANTYMDFDPYNGPSGTWTEHDNPVADASQIYLCDLIRKEGIDIFSIVFDVPNSVGGNKIRKIFRDDCAQEAINPGHYYEPYNSDELRAAFASIASQAISLRITK